MSTPCKWIDRWDVARNYYTAEEWGTIRAHARDHLTLHLHNNYKQEYRSWNNITDEAKRRVVDSVTAQAEAFATKHGEPIRFVHRVQWDVLAAIMEIAYAHCNPPLFYVHLLSVYEQGHFPCGWEGDWPEGALLYI